MLSVIYAKCRKIGVYVECHYVECRGANAMTICVITNPYSINELVSSWLIISKFLINFLLSLFG